MRIIYKLISINILIIFNNLKIDFKFKQANKTIKYYKYF